MVLSSQERIDWLHNKPVADQKEVLHSMLHRKVSQTERCPGLSNELLLPENLLFLLGPAVALTQGKGEDDYDAPAAGYHEVNDPPPPYPDDDDTPKGDDDDDDDDDD